MSNKAAIRSAFDLAAEHYDAAAVLQREVGDRLAERLTMLKLSPERVLDAGCGTGHAQAHLLQRFPEARLIQLDLALSMLQASRRRRPNSWSGWLQRLQKGRPQQICADIEKLPLADASVDCIWSNLTIQWCESLQGVFAECMRVLRPGGLLLFSTLGPDTLKELRHAFAQIDGQSHVNRFIDLHDVGDALMQTGFFAPVMEMEMLTMTYRTVRDVMQDLKGIGAHYVQEGQRRGLMGKQAWRRMEAAYDSFRQPDGLLPASYEVVYGHAWKPLPGPASGAHPVIPLRSIPL